jgi:hypothetical protein
MKNLIFLKKITEHINNGFYDERLTLPFMTKELLVNSIKKKIDRKLLVASTPILSDTEITECIDEVKETALQTIIIFLKEGFLERNETGYSLTNKGKLALKISFTL